MLNETLEYIGIAFVCSALLIVMSKIILQSLIRRPADFYAAEELRQEELMLNAGGLSIFSEHETTPEGDTIESSHLTSHISVDDEPEKIEERKLKTDHKEEREEHTGHIWDETYKDIRKSLEEAFSAKSTEEPETEEPEPPAEIPAAESPVEIQAPEPTAEEPAPALPVEEPATEPESAEKPQIPLTKSGKPRKPSKNMKKEELVAIAEYMGIEIPAKATKAVILELINQQK